MTQISALVLAPDTPESRLNDLDYARCVEEYGGLAVHRLDPAALYAERGMGGLEAEILEAVRRHDARILFYGLGMEFDFRPAFLSETLADVFRVLILGDDEPYFDASHRYYAQCFDLVLTNNPLYERFALYGIDARFLPNVFRPSLFSPGKERRKDIDVSFIGAMRGKFGRERYANALAHAGISIQLFGAGTPAGLVSQQEVVDIYRRSRINLNFTGGNLSTPLDRGLTINRKVRQIKGRATKIALCGSFVLSEYAPGIERLFAIGSEIDVFDNERQLVEKVRLYLANEKPREELAGRAYRRALAEYDEAKFWPRMLEEIRALMAGRRKSELPLAIDAAFWSGFGAWRFKYLISFLFTGRLGLFLSELALLARTRRFDASAAIAFTGLGLHFAGQRSKPASYVAHFAKRLRRAMRGSR